MKQIQKQKKSLVIPMLTRMQKETVECCLDDNLERKEAEVSEQGAISGVSAHLTYEIAHGGENGTSNFGTGTQLFLQGMVGGTASHLRGGRFQDGFMGAVVSKGVDLGLKGQNLNMYQEGSITVIAGGLASQAAGGSFEDGAIQAGMVFLYNANGRKVINNTKEAVEHYYEGDGETVELGEQTKTELRNHPKVRRQSEALRKGSAQHLSDNLSVDMESYTFHVGKTRVDFTTNCHASTCTTTYKGFVKDGFWDPNYFAPWTHDGVGSGGELGGTIYNYTPYIWKETYPDNFR